MGKSYPSIDDQLRAFVERQHMFFAATAPTSADGHVNCSPKGLDCLRILGPTTVAYLDYVGSGVETIAHIRQNGRIVLLFCAFEGPPKIVRLHGRGEVLEPQDEGFAALSGRFDPGLGARSIVRIELDRITDSCGYGVPLLSYQGERTQLPAWAERKGDAGIGEYQRTKNSASVDGLPALRWTEAGEGADAGASSGAREHQHSDRQRQS